MRVAVAVDSFKGSLTSLEAGDAVREGIKRVVENAEVRVCPLADGGEGTVEALAGGLGGYLQEVTVTGPLGEPVDCVYGIIPNTYTDTAVIEMSAAAGITLVPEEKRNPLYTTTYGVGEMIRNAIEEGNCRRFIIGIGGSATNDGGVGMLEALGYKFLNKEGEPIPRGAAGLKELASISDEGAMAVLRNCEFLIACDVNNPLCGKLGCGTVFGPQKGATPEMVEDMDQWLMHYGRLVQNKYAKADISLPGAGAAGGLGFAFSSFMNTKLIPGIELVLSETGLEDHVAWADVVVTGEGRIDAQTVMGKAPAGVAELTKRYNKPLIAFAGSVTEDAGECNAKGITAIFPIIKGVTTLDEAMEKETAKQNLADTAEQVFRLYSATGNR